MRREAEMNCSLGCEDNKTCMTDFLRIVNIMYIYVISRPVHRQGLKWTFTDNVMDSMKSTNLMNKIF